MPVDPQITAMLKDLLAESATALDSGNCEQGIELAREAYALADDLGDKRAQADALVLLARLLGQAGQHEDCSQVCDQAGKVLTELDDQAGLGQTLVVQALALNEIGLAEEALDSLAVAREIAARLNDRPLLFWVLNRIAVVHAGMQDHARAAQFQMRALELAEDLDADARFCIVNNIADNSIGLYRQRLAEDAPDTATVLEQALGYAERAVELALDPTDGTPYRQALAYDNHGLLLVLAGRLEAGLESILQARRIARENGFQALELATIYHGASALIERGDARQAAEELTVALERATASGELPIRMDIALELTRALELTGQFEAALRSHKEHTAVERQLRSAVAATRARRLEQLIEVDHARLDAADARTESQMYRARSRQLEAEVQALERVAADLDRRANEDALTRLSNRHHIEAELPRLLAGAAATGQPLSLAVLDLDHFKHINDTWGHQTGDEVLVAVAGLLRRSCRAGDLTGRFGGEEFLLALPGLTEPEAVEVCHRVRRSVQDHDWSSIRPGLRVTISIGVYSAQAGDEVRDLIEHADERLYRAKRSGRNRVEADPGRIGEEAS
ncbi:GGDEF domain-containing protein [Kineosporia babensis]|uniref:GGDEF domain-containing protein n=1 Tax=Kineosporia babensis TaxID=499548 RepID=A0A9X1NMN9_9ACTN|nr:GGDEF domain-containing protein [Kineosporia babensis]MCD5316339.1 GGDEF domain-containing protein [Kineosporia babensis]